MKQIFLVLFIAIVFTGCPEEGVVGGSDGNGFSPPEDFLSFSFTGITGGDRSYSEITAKYDPGMDVTTIETFDDSTTSGKFILSFQGAAAGTFRYTVTGSPDDTNHVHVWFSPEYVTGVPNGIFELTGVPEDSLEATLSVEYYGDVGDSVSGTMSALLKLEGSSPPFKALLHSGVFRVTRTD